MVFFVGMIVFFVIVVARLTTLTFKVRSQSREIMTYKLQKEQNQFLIMKLNSKIDHLKFLLHGKKEKSEEKRGNGENKPD